ncbi:hypothetical protein K493DRAFT_375381 [Basidiobolus meristosporus CBS 931.73]|uniref:G-protein coupled receptors family 1 profile domain-containing protein n=1 Tax=Basidiobolus meristosporus CBS 931.73 TaxID=1314790 RepID=A0A1Y1Y5M8_9FUNG|nr:hypothetical protein K493DRAFT_375381 [Basidiobolus meristosporus CBS 931.73]|eukprot:ORX93330.1 hypothetical protein K493DRAFT_375381 [Basidiobolus meristosporus CBS 931.73]
MASAFHQPPGTFPELEKTVQWINLASLATTLFVAVDLTSVIITRRYLINRFSGRMVLRLCVADIMVAVSNILSERFTTVSGCIVLNAINQFGMLVSALLTVALVHNLRLVLVEGKRDTSRHERMYVVATVVVSLVATLIPAIFGWVNGVCVGYESISPAPIRLLSIYLTYFLWILLALLYSIFAIPIVLMRRPKKSRVLSTSSTSAASAKYGQVSKKAAPSTAEREIRATVFRIVGYAWVLLLTHLPVVLSVTYNTIHASESGSTFLTYLMYVTAPTLGLLHFIIFLFDPAFRYVFPLRKKESLGEQAWQLVDDVASLEMPSADNMHIMKLI